jgi:hypothetical protein
LRIPPLAVRETEPVAPTQTQKCLLNVYLCRPLIACGADADKEKALIFRAFVWWAILGSKEEPGLLGGRLGRVSGSEVL